MGEMPLEPQTLQLNSAEELYAELRDKNFQAVGPVLSRCVSDGKTRNVSRHYVNTY